MKLSFHFLVKVFSFMCLTLNVNLLHAGNEPVRSAPLLGSKDSVKVNYESVVIDFEYFANQPPMPAIAQTHSIKNYVSVGIEEESPFLIQSSFTASINLKIYKYNQYNSIVDSLDSVLTVNYDTAHNSSYTKTKYISFQDAYKVKVVIVSIDTHGAAWDITRVLRVDNWLMVNRDYAFSCSTLVPDLQLNYRSAHDDVTASWNEPYAGQTEFDLEWAWIEDDALPNYTHNNTLQINKVFEGNSTRVTIEDNEYNIPLLYNREGQLYIRVRPVQLRSDGLRLEGAWTYENGNAPVVFNYSGHSYDQSQSGATLNWQAQTSFAEDGKSKSVVQYFDGTLRGRQTVTKDLSSNDENLHNTIVAETFYDYQGRPVIQVLPVPTLNTIIEYSKNFNKAVNHDGYPKLVYDGVQGTANNCASPAALMDVTSGASRYYSPYNDKISSSGTTYNVNNYIPDAHSYPFTETRYNADGEVVYQSGVGQHHIIGSGHETKYYYETPAQEELDALFGTDAGYASHYFKTVIKDANGQYSVSYTDMFGRTVATALMGDAPSNLESLESNIERLFTKQLLTEESNRVEGRSIVSVNKLLVPKSGNYTFNYDLTPQQLKLFTCNEPAEELCFDCLYDLKITITAECDDEPFTTVIKNYNNITLNTNQSATVCDANGNATTFFNAEFTVNNMPEGMYTVSKILTLNQDAQRTYRDVFINQNDCKELVDFYNEELQTLINSSICELTCESCTTALGSFTAYKQNFLDQTGISSLSPETEQLLQVAYNEATQNCERLCNDNNQDGLDWLRNIKDAMLADVSPPMGQYADLNRINSRYNIFNNAGFKDVFLQSAPAYNFPVKHEIGSTPLYGNYYNELGQIDNPPTSTPAGFTDIFKDAWAEQLLPHHPEYCMYKTAMEILPATYAFAAKLETLNTWAEVKAATTTPGQLITNIIGNDPFFNVNVLGAHYTNIYNEMVGKMNAYSSVTTQTSQQCPNAVTLNVSMWQLARTAVFCRNIPVTCDANAGPAQCMQDQAGIPEINPSVGCAADWDYVWKTFRTLYLNERDKLIFKFLESQNCNEENINGSTVKISNRIRAENYQPRFINASNPNSNGSIGHSDLTTLINQTASANPAAQTTANSILTAQFEPTCRGYIDTWITQLEACDVIRDRWENSPSLKSSDVSWLTEHLVAVCVSGSDQFHPFGSSSTKPPSVTVGGFKNFPQVISHYFEHIVQSSTDPYTELCHPYLITAPAPYEAQQILTELPLITRPDDCECQKISTIKSEYDNANFAGDFRIYLAYKYGTQVSADDLDLLLSLCNGQYTCNFIPEPIMLPVIFQCKNTGESQPKACINCYDYFLYKEKFAIAMGFNGPVPDPSTEQHLNINTAFQNYVNYHTGFSKTWMEYLEFEEACNNYSTIPCELLTGALNAFLISSAYYQNPVGEDCSSAFEVFMNNYFNVFFTYQMWVELFAQCGEPLNICLPVITCQELNNVVKDFYSYKTWSVFDDGDCETAFVDFFNRAFENVIQTPLTYLEIELIYNYVCGCSLNICTFPNAFSLNSVYDDYVDSLSRAPWEKADCESLFESYFSNYFSLSPPLSFQTIKILYNNYPNPGCVRDINNLCIPEISCETLEYILELFLGENGGNVENLPDCRILFEQLFYHKTGYSFKYEKIAQIYLIRCGKVLNLCNVVKFDCTNLLLLTQGFIPNPNGSRIECENEFAERFNGYYHTNYSFSEIYALYENMCGVKLLICETQPPTTCQEINYVLEQFYIHYPDPKTQLMEGRCRDVFTALFNITFGTAYNFEEIKTYYINLCGHYIGLCESDCEVYKDFVTEFQNQYGYLQIPLSAKKLLFTYLYNQRFIWGNSPNPYAASAVINSSGIINILPPVGWSGSMVVSYEQIEAALSDCMLGDLVTGDETVPQEDCRSLEDMKQTFLLMYPLGLPQNCSLVFTSWFNFTMQTQMTSLEIKTLYETYCGTGSSNICPTYINAETYYPRQNQTIGTYMPPMLCGLNEPLFPTVEYADPDPCAELNEIAMGIAEEKWELYQNNFKDNFDVAYFEKCMQARSLESFTVTYNTAEYHYTLYYYDQAGNLVKTVPPAGVDAKHAESTFLQNVKDYRAAVKNGIEESDLNREVPDHSLVTHYRYNTLNQVIAQKTPDAGVSYFWYDRLGRLVISQNAQQFEDNKFSYTLYDALGRITEVGQKPQTYSMSQLISRNPVALEEWLTSDGVAQDVRNKEQITQTVYDYANEDIDLYLIQKNLRGRVSYTQVFNEEPDPLPTYPLHNSATYYSYDIHGNVKELLQDYGNPAAFPNVMNTTNNRFKKLVYNYDLVSGKVNEVHYQSGEADAFYHRYQYDNENRLTTVETSRDYVIWEKDARYTYYRHGPLARVVLGHQQVQGVDYAYTLQGWLKGVNSTAVGDGTYDMGFDGKTGSTHSNIARDVFGFSLNYFAGDYASINVNPFATISNNLPNITDIKSVGKDLFNGNIRAMLMNIPKLGDAHLYGYRYDQLNRITAMNTYTGLSGSNTFTALGTDNYRERISYDANGNILTYLRNGTTSGSNLLAMDDLTYHYQPGTNQLDHVDDAVSSGNYTIDIDDQNTFNYSYDEIGNLTSDVSEGITNIEWNVYGKIKSITKSSGTISYTYDVSGNRISKTYNGKTTWYVRDASGNVMSVYAKDASVNNNHLTQNEVHLYGSSRLGILNVDEDMEVAQQPQVGIRGNKFFELSNHLGNVLVTISDKKLQIDDGNGNIDYYTADIVTANDYYPFGMLVPERKFDAGKYRYGFNGKENDNDVKGEGNQLDYGARILDTRLGRFLSVDPLAKQFAYYSPYQSTGNNPIRFVDLDGQEPTSPPEFLKNIRLVYDLNKGNTIDGYFNPNDRLEYMTVEKIYDEIKKQAFFVHKDNQGNAFYWVSQENTLRIHRKKDGTTEANGHWERYETYEQTQQRIRAGAPDVILAFLGGGAAIGFAAPVVIAAAPTVGTYGTAAFTMTAGERGVSAGADALIQYSQNIPEHGFGFKNLSNLNLSSIAGSAASGVPLVSNTIGNGLELSFNIEKGKFSYKGIGSTDADYSSMGIKTVIGTAGGMGGNALDKALGKYMNAGKLWNKAASDVISGGVSGAAQKIVDYSKQQ